MSQRKRKKCPPRRLEEIKRQRLAWDMRDLARAKLEAETEERILASPANGMDISYSKCLDLRRSANTSKRSRKSKSRDVNSREMLNLNVETSLSQIWHCVIGTFGVSLIGGSDNVSNHVSEGFPVEISSSTQTSDTEIKITLPNLDSFIDAQLMGQNHDRHASTSTTKDPLPKSLQSLSLKATTDLQSDNLEAIVFLQKKGILTLVLNSNVSIFDDYWELQLCLVERALTKMVFSSQDTTVRRTDRMIMKLMNWFYKCDFSDGNYDDGGCGTNGDSAQNNDTSYDSLYHSVKCIREQSNANSMMSDSLQTKYTGRTCESENKSCTHPSRSSSTDVSSANLSHSALSLISSKPEDDPEELLFINDSHTCVSNQLTNQHVQHPCLLPTLRQYQCRAVEWMTKKETGLVRIQDVERPTVHPLWTEYCTLDGKVIYFNKYNGRLTREKFPDPPLPSGGILADEMGLGKTVEVLACILNNPVPHTKPLSENEPSSKSLLIDGPPYKPLAEDGPSSKLLPIDEPPYKSLPENEPSSKLLPPCKPLPEREPSSKPLPDNDSARKSLPTDEPPYKPLAESEPSSKPLPDNESTSTPLQENRSSNKRLPNGKSKSKPEISNESLTSSLSEKLPSLEPHPNCEASKKSIPHNKPASKHLCTNGPPKESLSENVCSDPQFLNFEDTCSDSLDTDTTTNSNQLQISDKSLTTENDIPNWSVNCECVCGNNEAGPGDRLLCCTACNVVLHAECLGHVEGIANHISGFLCPHCAVNRLPISSGATLIISPASIAHQWVEEITRHTSSGALRVLVYEGVLKQGFIQPEVIADHDIVLTTYSTLRADFYHVGAAKGNAGRTLRYQKRYLALPSPLTAITFWRICLDEAQMVESTTAKAAEMALRLHCVHRWCVTGTPIQKGLEDLYGLLLFLGMYPYCQRVWWNKLLYQPYLRGHREPMQHALAQVLWRTAKKDVLHEIQLPPQTDHVTTLTFTPVEQHFYQRQHEECSASAQKMLSQWNSADTKLSSIDKHTVHRMLVPLLRLRQACCHPQAVRGGFLSVQKSTLTMDQLLETLISRTKLECEEAHRQVLFAINGLAGIEVIKKQWPEAVERYRDAMRSWKEHEEKFRTDALQKLHTLHNLVDVLSKGHPGCSHTLRDDSLKDEVRDLKESYMAKSVAAVHTALANLESADKDLQQIKLKVDFQSPWWILAIQETQEARLSEELMGRVRDELSGVATDGESILNRASDVRGLQYVITTKLDMVETTHDTLVTALEQLRTHPTPEMVQATAECCLRAKPGRAHRVTRCRFCEVDDLFTEYESRLFGHQGMKGVSELQEESNLDWHRYGNTGGLRAETETEKTLKTVLAFIRLHRIATETHQEARQHLTFMAGRRREFKFLRAVWFALRERVTSLDELDMCATRMRLALPGETVSEDEKHVMYDAQVDQQRMKFVSDRIVAQSELRKKLGQLLYLTNLAKTQTSHKGENPDLCPVCTRALGKEWSVFSCGHCFCCQCVWVLLRQAGIGPRNRDVHIKCPMCRVPTLAREISYVSTTKYDDQRENRRLPVKGSHSTKVEAVVGTLLKIHKDDVRAKSLVFSTWQDVLDVIGMALTENSINFRHITTSKKLPDDLHAFKTDPTIPVLLLPLQTGSNGLNIIEATHVLLVEPALNPAHELQAVGRVHRIGQTRPTHVHRFIIHGTVESRMFSLLKGKSCASVRTGSRDTENSSLTIGDLTSLFTSEDETDQLPGLLDQDDGQGREDL